MVATSLPDSPSTIGANCTFGEHVVIGDRVCIGDRVRIGHHVVIHPDTVIGDDVQIADHAVLGRPPLLSPRSSAAVETHPTPLHIGHRCRIGTGAVIASGTWIDDDTFVGDQAFVRERVRIGRHVIIGRATAVENDTTIGDETRIQANAYITAYMVIEERVFIAPCVTTTNDNSMARAADVHAIMRGPMIRRGARIGGNSILLPGIEIGADAVVAAGAVVTRDVPPGMVVMGVPARVVRTVAAEELLP